MYMRLGRPSELGRHDGHWGFIALPIFLRPSPDGPTPMPVPATRRVDPHTSVCSAISSASATSIPRYRTVLSTLTWPSSS